MNVFYKTCGVILTDVTDHCMTFLRYPVTKETDNDNQKTRNEFRLKNYEKIIKKFTSIYNFCKFVHAYMVD